MRAVLYVDGISPADINQGRIPDCTLQATLASLARTPEGQAVIRGCIQERKDASGASYYHVDIFEKDAAGRFAPVSVDVTPCELQYPGAIRVVDATGAVEAWPRVLEAAMLKTNGGPVCNVRDAYGILTGRVAIDTSTSDATFESRLQMGWQTKKVQVLSTTGADPSELAKLGLQPTHAYTVVGVVPTARGTVVLLRNPWGFDDRTLPLEQVKKGFPTYSEGAL
jgi:hypothetical protein